MERYFLIPIILILLSSCQSIDLREAITEFRDKPSNIDSSQDNETYYKTYGTIWEYMRDNSTYVDYEIDDQTLSYMNKYIANQDQFNMLLNNSYYFIFYAIEIFEEKNIPIDLTLVPFIESNYDPFSISPSGAVGLWQFMPKTGELFDLNKTWWDEGRHDPYKSTNAAAEYFAYLLKRFDNDMIYALISYNAGPSFLQKQLKKSSRRNQSTEYKSLNLSNQTQNYIPKFFAIRELILNSEKYDLVLPDIPYRKVVKKVDLPGQVEIMSLAEYLQVEPSLIYRLNAGYTKWASAPSEKSSFFLPYERALYLENNNEIFNEKSINWISHKVSQGDNLWDLAKKYDTEVDIIKQINNLKREVLSIDQNLLIPLSKSESNNFIPYEMHIVSEGDTLWSISNKYNIKIKDLVNINSLHNNKVLTIGMQLSIGNKNIHRNIESKKRTILYSVKQGDNLYKISELFDVEISDIIKDNSLKNKILMPGDIIKISIKAF